jgi:hypothetical protein
MVVSEFVVLSCLKEKIDEEFRMQATLSVFESATS